MKYNSSMENDDYQLIDSGSGQKLELFGRYLVSRPAGQAVWNKQESDAEWNKAKASFTREDEKKWNLQKGLPTEWSITVSGIKFKIQPTDFGHLGIFPEQKPQWRWIQETISKENRPIKVLNLFAYSGGSTLAAAKAGAEVVHLDASKGMVAWARENADLNNLTNAPIRWIIDDVKKFLKREIRRENRYDAIILDPPSFGRGSKGEVFKIEEDIIPLLNWCQELLSDDPLFILFSCHTPGFTPTALGNLVSQMMQDKAGTISTGEMFLEGTPEKFSLPSGAFARWYCGDQ
ncbi:MAG: class I SAM-dependent methyltransferase [Chlamydiota bacterium]|nr:class I SAM-dependent methyltransferase [Chlamydiota bacterium]